MMEGCPLIVLMQIYVPNLNVTEEYTPSLFDTAATAVHRIVRMGAVPLIGMDSNCPFKSPGQYPNSRNARYLQKFLEDLDLSVLNWDPRATGFISRVRGKEQSQLDLLIGPRCLLDRMHSLNIDKRIHFNSDHCGVDLALSMRLDRAPATKGRAYTKYTFSEDNIAKLVAELNRKLPEWNRDLKAVGCADGMG